MNLKLEIQLHAETHLGHRGRVAVSGFRKLRHISQATVILTGSDSVEFYTAYADYGAVGLTLTRTERLSPLPLLDAASPCQFPA